MQPDQPTPKAIGTKDAQCERCGSFDATEFAGQFLCADCITLAGCGCAGHGDDPAE